MDNDEWERLCFQANQYALSLEKQITTAVRAIEHMQSMAGHPQATEACRLIIMRGNQALNEIKKLQKNQIKPFKREK